MIKINLLPSHILEQGKAKYWVVGVLVVLIVVGAVLFMVNKKLDEDLALEDLRIAHWTAQADKVAKVQASASSVVAQTKPYGDWNGFFKAMGENNLRYATQLEEIAKCVHRRVVLHDLTVNGASVTMTGVAPNLDAVTTAYMNLMEAKPFIKESVTLRTTVPAWNGGRMMTTPEKGLPMAPGESPITLTANLQPNLVIVNPVPPAAGMAVTGGTTGRTGTGPGGGGTLRMRL